MKMLLVVVLSVLPLLASARSIQVDGQTIREGDSVGKLVRYMGSPLTKSFVNRWCDRKKRSTCVEETWTYYQGDRQWTVKIFKNEITEMEWTRH
ncbi:MAG: hypothetical protein OQK12_16860 [Motiliproteus sp.]|nr:hypothetical protein [Motiliproteus sp.]MCW9051262.1 hypothetical protein [Motiliproteus sp.]